MIRPAPIYEIEGPASAFSPMMGYHHHGEDSPTTLKSLVQTHPYLSLAAAVASGLMLSKMSGTEESQVVGWLGPIGKIVKHAVASNPLTLQARYAANLLNSGGGGGGRGAPAQPPMMMPPPMDPSMMQPDPSADQGDGTSGHWQPANSDGMHYMSGGSPWHHAHRRRPRHWWKLSRPAQHAVLGCSKIIPAPVAAGLFGALDTPPMEGDQATPAFVNALNQNPSGPALLRALSEFIQGERQKRRGRGGRGPAAAAMGWAWSDLNPFKSKAGKLLVSTVPGGATATQAHAIAAKALKSGALKPEHLKKAGALAKAGRKGDPIALKKIAAVKRAAGKGNPHAEVALDRIKLAHCIQTGKKCATRPAGGNALTRTFKAGLATLPV